MKDLGLLTTFLGMSVTFFEQYCEISQRAYAEQLVERYYEQWYPIFPDGQDLPLPPDAMELLAHMSYGADSPLDEQFSQWFADFPYRSVVGALLYLAMNTRPDIAFPVGLLARYGHNITWNACLCASRLLAYVSTTAHLSIQYEAGETPDLHMFCDSDWASDKVNRRSCAAYIAFMCRGPIAWSSKLMPTICTSSGEAEYGSLYLCTQEVCWLRGLVEFLEDSMLQPTPVFMDNTAAIQLAYNPVFHARTKHIDTKVHWLRQMYADWDDSAPHSEEEIPTRVVLPAPSQSRPKATLFHVRSATNIADLPSKVNAEEGFVELRSRMLGETKEAASEVPISDTQPARRMPEGAPKKP